MKKISSKTFIMFFCLSLIISGTVFAQRQVGTLRGVVTDTEGNLLPGVTITVTSPAMMGSQTFVTTQAGTYRFPSLPPGTYTLRAELSGFTTLIRENIIIPVGAVITMGVTCGVAAIDEEVTVTASAPVVDVKQSKLTVNIESSTLENLPSGRRLTDVLLTAPGFGGSRHHLGAGQMGGGYMGSEGLTMHGSDVESNAFGADGLIVNDPSTQVGPLVRYNIDSVDEVELITAGQAAETPFVSGVYVNVVTKAGGNDFSGGATFYYTDENLTEELWTEEELQSLSIQPPVLNKYNYDISVNLGGPIFRDKLWFYTNVRYEEYLKKGNLIEWTDPLGVFHENYDSESNAKTFFLKLSSQITKKLKVFALIDYSRTLDTTGEYEPHPYQLKITTNYYDQWRLNVKLNATYIFSQNLFMDFSAGHVNRYFPSLSQEEGAGRPWIRDYAVPYDTFTGRARDSINYRRVTAFQSDLTYFKDNFLLGGNHEIKVGARLEIDPGAYDNFYANNLRWYWSDGPYYYGTRDSWTHSLTGVAYNNVGEGRVAYYNMGTYKGSVYMPRHSTRVGSYIQDSVTFGNRLTVNLGLRFDYQTLSLPASFQDEAGDPMSIYVGETYIKPYTKENYPEYFPDGINPFVYREMGDWNNLYTWIDFSPRIGIIYDLFGNGKTALKGSYSRYSSIMSQQYGPHPLSRKTLRTTWYDTNPNPNVDQATPWLMIDEKDDFVVYPYDYRALSLEYCKQAIDPDYSSPKTDEFLLGIQHELLSDFSFGFNFIYKHTFNLGESVLYSFDHDEYWYHIDQPLAQEFWIPFTTVVPGTNGYPDRTVTMYARSNDAPPLYSRRTNVPELKRRYWTFEFTFNKRMSNGWQLQGSIAYSKAYGNSGGYYRDETPGNPNYFVNRFGRINIDVPLMIKLSSTINLGYGFIFSGFYRHFSGEPWARTASIRPPADWCEANNVSREYYSVLIEPQDTRRYKGYDFIDLRLEKQFAIKGSLKAGIFVDVYNLLGYTALEVGQQDVYRYNPSGENVSEPENVTQQSTYQVVSGAKGLRTINLSIRFSF
jgi:hypothetical protein